MKRIWMLLALCLLCLCTPAMAEEELIWEAEPTRVVERGELLASLPAVDGEAHVYATRIDGEHWLFLPAFADVETLSLSLDGEAVTWEEISLSDGVWQGDAVKNGEKLFSLRAMKSENLRALFLFSDDPVNQGREYIDGSERHVNRTTGAMAIVDVNGSVDHAGALRQLRGRGNSSWALDKKPYQFKLEDAADLIKTGKKSENSRTWTLLADMMDSTSLHNRIVLDLSLEMGIAGSSHCEHVDLYYDGEYRGLYLLTEKVEVAEGRVDVDDYEKIIEAMNQSIGRMDLESLETAKGENRFGNEYTYVQDVAVPESLSAGAYLLEMEGESTTLSDRCWFRMSDGSVIASKNPENPSREMMDYISTRLEEARRTLKAGGVNPETGRTIHDDFDVDAFARLAVIGEQFYNVDNYYYSSSWFVLPKGETRFTAATPWDYDVSMRYRIDGFNGGGAGAKMPMGWMEDFFNCDDFTAAFQRIYEQEMCPLIDDVLLGEKEGRYLKPLDVYVRQIRASRRMNDQIWKVHPMPGYVYTEDFDQEIALLRDFLTFRQTWLKETIPAIDPHSANTVSLWGRALYAHVEHDPRVLITPWSNAEMISCTFEQVTEATEEDYAVWHIDMHIKPKDGYAFEDPVITFNGTSLACEMQEDGSLRLLAAFEDPSYRPVDYWGDDIGLVYNPEIYAQNYPEIAAEYEDDPEGLMEYFCDEGMYEGHMGNAFFDPENILAQNPELLNFLGTDWMLYYWDFIDFGHEEHWLTKGDAPGFGLEVWDAL